jgi:hypothetical protein
MRDSLASVSLTAAFAATRTAVFASAFPVARAVACAVACALPFAALSAPAQSAELASIAVSLVIPQTCVIASQPGLAQGVTRPIVTCMHNEPYGIAQTPLDPTEAASTLQLAAPGTRAAVWTVGF